jgi:hypothetical protein
MIMMNVWYVRIYFETGRPNLFQDIRIQTLRESTINLPGYLGLWSGVISTDDHRKECVRSESVYISLLTFIFVSFQFLQGDFS